MIVYDNILIMDTLLKEERQQLILAMLSENNKVTVTDLSQRFGTSEVTIRRDLADLATEGKLVRTHRGALSVTPALPEPPVVQRMAQEHDFKKAIARGALPLVHNGESIFIGSGSTMTVFARMLGCRKHLTVFTNALNIAIDLANCENEMTVVVTGGVVHSIELSLFGHIAEMTLPEVRVNKVFMGAQAISLDGGWTTDHIPEVSTTRHMLDMSPELIILADHTKLGRTAAAFITPVTRITTLVTDTQANAALVAQLIARGVQVITA
jgi:DeoR/GlpR family transcriptional regulator of sugar metabolism